MAAWSQPKNLKQLRGFMGLTEYYYHFIQGYATIVVPLIDLLNKDSFIWEETVTKLFEVLKVASTSPPLLKLSDFNREFVFKTDASNTGIVVILSRMGHLISYFSKKLSPLKQTTSTYTKELLAIIELVLK